MAREEISAAASTAVFFSVRAACPAAWSALAFFQFFLGRVCPGFG